MNFGVVSDSSNSTQVCIQKGVSDWKSINCETDKQEISSGKFNIQCKCKELTATTIVSDVENIFSDSKVNEVFSSEGLE